ERQSLCKNWRSAYNPISILPIFLWPRPITKPGGMTMRFHNRTRPRPIPRVRKQYQRSRDRIVSNKVLGSRHRDRDTEEPLQKDVRGVSESYRRKISFGILPVDLRRVVSLAEWPVIEQGCIGDQRLPLKSES